MSNPIMGSFNTGQASVGDRGAALTREYSRLWKRMISEWQSPDGQNRAWLLYSANYLFRTAGVRWALDPLRLRQRLLEAPLMDARRDLEELSLALLTHRHIDHLDLGLVGELSELPIRWVVPEDLLELVRQAGLADNRIIVPRPLEALEIDGLRITPFDGLHWADAPELPQGRRGVPSMGYCVEWDGKRWLFPGDVRTLSAERLPALGRLDGAFVHLWLGKRMALVETPPRLEEFCRFCAGINTPRLILTHLWEVGRTAEECWTDRHAEMVRQRLGEIAPGIEVRVAKIGEAVDLG